MGNSSSSTLEEQLEEKVLHEQDYHRVLQEIGRPSFEPGDGSFVEWVFQCMFHTHKEAVYNKSPQLRAVMNLDTFLYAVSKGPASQMTVNDHERFWNCYLELCDHYERPPSPFIYHTLWLDTSPLALGRCMARRADFEGLKIICHFFSIDRWELLYSLPLATEPKKYLEMIPWKDPDMKERIVRLVERKYRDMGAVDYVLPLIDAGMEYEPDSILLAQLKEKFANMPIEPNENGHFSPLEFSFLKTDSTSASEFPKTDSTVTSSITDTLSLGSQSQCDGFEALDTSISAFLDTHVRSENKDLDGEIIFSFIKDLRLRFQDMYDTKGVCSLKHSSDTSAVPPGVSPNHKQAMSSGTLGILVNSQSKIIGDQEQALREVEGSYERLRYDHEMETTASMARIDHLERLLHQTDMDPRSTPTGNCDRAIGGMVTDRSVQIRRMAVALELSENRRAEAIEALSRERELCAKKVQKLISMFHKLKQ